MKNSKIVFACVVVVLCGLVTWGGLRYAAAQQNEPDTLGAKLDELAANSTSRLPADLLKTMQQAVEDVRKTGIEESAKQVGDTAIDAELVGWDGESYRLSELWSEGPVVLMWYRGGWCPYCNLQLRAMQEQLSAIEGAGAKLVVLTPELPEKAKATAEANDLAIVALHDKDNEVAKQYGIAFELPESIVPMYRDRLKLDEYNGNNDMELPLSATYVVDRGGVIRYAFLDADYKKRAEPAEVVAAVQSLSGPPKVGQSAPDFELDGLDGKAVSLSEELKKGPTVVVVLRGYPGYQCPICTRQVADLIGSAKKFAAKSTRVILVYPGPAERLGARAQEFLSDTHLPENFSLVVDPDYGFTNAYGLRWDAPRETAYPSTFVVGKDGKVTFAKVSKTHGGRADTKQVLEAIE